MCIMERTGLASGIYTYFTPLERYITRIGGLDTKVGSLWGELEASIIRVAYWIVESDTLMNRKEQRRDEVS